MHILSKKSTDKTNTFLLWCDLICQWDFLFERKYWVSSPFDTIICIKTNAFMLWHFLWPHFMRWIICVFVCAALLYYLFLLLFLHSIRSRSSAHYLRYCVLFRFLYIDIFLFFFSYYLLSFIKCVYNSFNKPKSHNSLIVFWLPLPLAMSTEIFCLSLHAQIIFR